MLKYSVAYRTCNNTTLCVKTVWNKILTFPIHFAFLRAAVICIKTEFKEKGKSAPLRKPFCLKQEFYLRLVAQGARDVQAIE